MKPDQPLAVVPVAPVVEQLLALLRGDQAHAPLTKAVANLSPKLLGVVPEGLPYSAWQLMEHLRLAQRDILEFCEPPAGGYRPRRFPEDYWPGEVAPPSLDAWDRCLAEVWADRERFEALLRTPDTDLLTPFPWGDGQNLLREALLLADHNSYHTGELILLRRLLGAWPQ